MAGAAAAAASSTGGVFGLFWHVFVGRFPRSLCLTLGARLTVHNGKLLNGEELEIKEIIKEKKELIGWS